MPGKKASKGERIAQKKAKKHAAKGIGVNAVSYIRTGTGSRWRKHKTGAADLGKGVHAEIQALGSIAGQSIVKLVIDAFPCTECNKKLIAMTTGTTGEESKGAGHPSIVVECTTNRYIQDHTIPTEFVLTATGASESNPCVIYYHRGAKSFAKPATFPIYS